MKKRGSCIFGVVFIAVLVLGSGHPVMSGPVAQGKGKPVLEITTTVDFGVDRGQNFGSLFEARNADGSVVYGAGFAGLYNTGFRMDRFTLQFFIRSNDNSQVVFEKLPPPSDDGGNYLFDVDGRVYQLSWYHDKIARWWDDETRTWQADESFGRGATEKGEGKMRVAGKVLQFKDREAWYDGKKILSKAETGYYYDFYYAMGYLVFFHTDRSAKSPYSRLYAVPWIPGHGPVDLSKAIILDLKHPVEVTFAMGQLNKEIIVSTNKGNVYAFNVKGREWRSLLPLLECREGYCQQMYSMLNWYDKMLIGTYPMGNLFEYDGKQIRRREGWPPRMKGVGGYGREAQTTCIYGGDLYVGVWPWGELWRYDAGQDKWCFVRRMFQHPPPDEERWPWEDAIKECSWATHAGLGAWGQRVTGLVPMGDALYISVAARGCYQRDMRLEFLHDDEVWNEYRTVHRMRRPGCSAAAIRWTGKPTKLQFTITDESIVIAQDGRELARAPINAARADQVKDAEIQWGHGVFGPLRGTIRSKAVGP